MQMLWVNLIMDSLGMSRDAHGAAIRRAFKEGAHQKERKHHKRHDVEAHHFAVHFPPGHPDHPLLEGADFSAREKRRYFSEPHGPLQLLSALAEQRQLQNKQEYILYGTENSWSNDIKIQQMCEDTYKKYNRTKFLSDDK